LGLFLFVPDKVNQYIGEVAKKVALCKHNRLSHIPGRKEISTLEIDKVEQMHTFNERQIINIGDITITPYFVSHSACDAYMFVIEANGKRILHTGDFRGHGYLSKGLLPTIKKYILKQGKIDFLITEGTMISRSDERVKSENELKFEVMEIMKQYKNVFVMCSSTDMERLATFYAANENVGGKPFLCDDFQQDILNIFSDSAGKMSDLFSFKSPYQFKYDNTKLINWMQDKGFCMLVRATDKFNGFVDALFPSIDMEETVLIFSMWKEYINPNSKHANKRYLDFVGKFPYVKKIHTSGHASADCLVDVCNLVNPTTAIIPIHSEHSADFMKLPINQELKPKVITSSSSFENVTIEIPN